MSETVSPFASLIQLQAPDSAALESRAQRALRFAHAFTIESDGDYQNAAEELGSIKSRQTALKAEEEKLTKPLHQAHKAAIAFFSGPRGMLEAVEGVLKSKMLVYRSQQEAKAAEEKRKAEDAMAVERQRLAAEAEAIRRVGAEREAAAADPEAAAAIAQETLFKAAAAEQAAAVIVAAPVAAPIPTAKGISVAKTYEGKVTDMAAFIRFVSDNMAERPELVGFLSVDSIKLRAQVKASGENLNWPGITVASKQTMRAA